MAQYVDDCPSTKTTVCYRRGGNFCLDIMTLLSLKTTLARSFNQIYLPFDSCALTLCAYCMIVSYSTFHLLSLQTSHPTLSLLLTISYG